MTLRRRPHRVCLAAILLVVAAGLLARPALAQRATEPTPSADAAALEQAVSEIESLIADAHFRTALGVARSTRQWADDLDPHPSLRALRARLHVGIATARIALGDEGRARDSMRRALREDPELAFDERTTSPRVTALLRSVRRGAPTRSRAP